MICDCSRVQGIATSVSRLPTFRRRYQGVVKILITFAHVNVLSPAEKNKGSPSDASLSSQGSVRIVKPQPAQFTEASIVSPGKNSGGSWKGYSSLDGDDRV